MKRSVSFAALAVLIVGCGSPDVTGASVEDAMKEREAKVKALDAKEGKKPGDYSKELEQDPQAGGK